MKEIILKLDRFEVQNLLTNIEFWIKYMEEDFDKNNQDEALVIVTNQELYKKIKKQLEEQK